MKVKTAIELIRELNGLWEGAEDACDSGGFVENHIVDAVSAYLNLEGDPSHRNLLCDFVEKIGRKSHTILKGVAEAEKTAMNVFQRFGAATIEYQKEFAMLMHGINSAIPEDGKKLELDAWEFNWLHRNVAGSIKLIEAKGIASNKEFNGRLQTLLKKLDAMDKP